MTTATAPAPAVASHGAALSGIFWRGEKKAVAEQKEDQWHRYERSYGSFYRVIPLPEGVDADQANATFRDGVLQIELQVPQQRRARRRHVDRARDRVPARSVGLVGRRHWSKLPAARTSGTI